MTVLDPLRDDAGWRFTTEEPDPVNGFGYLSEVYRATDPAYEMRVTVPVLWDRARGQIVNNESADLLRMLNGWSRQGSDLYPAAYRDEIDSVNDRVYRTVNNGVYRAGFASRQDAYEEAFAELFASLDWLEQRLGDHRYLVGPHLTEADIRLFVTLVRFDAVYVGHFKCNQRRIADYPALSGYLRDLYAHAGVAETVNFDHIKRHYYMTHPRSTRPGSSPWAPSCCSTHPTGARSWASAARSCALSCPDGYPLSGRSVRSVLNPTQESIGEQQPGGKPRGQRRPQPRAHCPEARRRRGLLRSA